MRTRQTFREMNQHEASIINSLLSKDFPGRDEIREQINSSLVRSTECTCGCLSIEFYVKSFKPVLTKERIPVEASYYNNGKPHEILLHIVDRKVYELEFVSYSDIVDINYPLIEALQVKINEK